MTAFTVGRRTLNENDFPYEGLAATLLEAAEDELGKTGIEKISLRAVAKRAGVSHGAPAHHFGDARGLLTALAAEGYRRLLIVQTEREIRAGDDPHSRFVASGLGYIDFAVENPELFQLMFNSAVPDRTDERFQRLSLLVFEGLVRNTKAHNGHDPYTDPESMKALMASWSVVHGLAELVISGRAERTLQLSELSAQEREKTLADILERVNQKRDAQEK